jgi:beta-barrel assembly-enhancing protease
MKNALSLCRPLLLAGVFLFGLSVSAQEQPSPGASLQTQSTSQLPKKLKVKRGNMQDIDAIGKRNITGWDWYSIATETKVGQQLAQEVDSEVDLVLDAAITAYVNRIGQELVRNSDAQVSFSIKVVNANDPLAYALPGGILYVNTGLILAASNEAELAGVMSHAIAHVAARHVTRLLTRMQIANYMDMPLIPVSYTKCNVYAICEHEPGLGLPMAFLRFSRAFELEADYLGVQYMYKAGYEPNAFVAFLERLESQEGKYPAPAAKTFSSHPTLAHRIQQAKKEIAAVLPASSHATVNTPAFDDIKARVARLRKTAPIGVTL